MNGILIGERCPYCQKFRNPKDILHQPGGVRICLECEQRHLEALKSLQACNFLGQCSECGLDATELKAQHRCGPLGQMAVHYEGGKYRAMCLVCNSSYVPKRRELYGRTEFGNALKL